MWRIHIQNRRSPTHCHGGRQLFRSNHAGTRASLLALLLISFGRVLPARSAVAQEVGQRFQDCLKCPVMVVLPPGSFQMGSSKEGYDDERPQHQVTIESPFAVGVYEVTFAEWDACVNAGGCFGYSPPGYVREGGRHPVVRVSWDEAWAYTAWLSQETGETYRLLSEAEWEYMARAGTQTEWYWGDDASYQCSYANGNDRHLECSDGSDFAAPVGSFRANAFGLNDVLGNVWEWTEDCWNGDYSGAPADGSARRLGDCSQRVVRGGSWLLSPRGLRSAFRLMYFARYRGMDLGFRVARTID